MQAGALMRAAGIAGALQAALAQAVQYAGERVQFGRPISKFQAIQHQLAEMATHAASVGVAADVAARAMSADPTDAAFEIAAAKLRAADAAQLGASIAHQTHGAIGCLPLGARPRPSGHRRWRQGPVGVRHRALAFITRTRGIPMKVSEALDSRFSCRAFKDTPVPRDTIIEILETAKRAPSGGNLQPWHVYVVGGEELAGFKKLIASKLPENPMGEGSEYNVYPPKLKEPYRSRRFKVGEDMYASIGVAREDKVGRLTQFGGRW